MDTGATPLSLPTALIEKSGPSRASTRRVTSSAGPAEAGICESVRLTIQGRICTMDMLEVPDGVSVLLRQITLEHLDFVIDMRDRKPIGNPAHGGEHACELH